MGQMLGPPGKDELVWGARNNLKKDPGVCFSIGRVGYSNCIIWPHFFPLLSIAVSPPELNPQQGTDANPRSMGCTCRWTLH